MDCFTDREEKYDRIETTSDGRMKQPNDAEPNILTTTYNIIYIYNFYIFISLFLLIPRASQGEARARPTRSVEKLLCLVLNSFRQRPET
jgi:hypothetical protein